MKASNDAVVFLNCDNALLDYDLVQKDLRDHLAREFGVESRDQYWAILEALRTEQGYVDYLGALQRYRLEEVSDSRMLLMSSFLVELDRVTTIFPRQGHYAHDPLGLGAYPAADLTIEHIGDLVALAPRASLPRTPPGEAGK